MKNLGKKQKITLIVIGIAIVLVLIVGASYAYFQSMIDTGKKAPVDVITDTTDNLVFNVEDNINLAINKYNFGPGNGDLTSQAKATAKLRANSTDNTATYNYYLYFNIESNEFVYTTTDNKPEIILTITDPSGNPVTSVTGLTYVTAGGVSGFDITTASGLFEIANNYAITSNSSTQDTLQEWNFTATFINLDSDQNDNTGKSMNGSVVIQRVPVNSTLADACKNGDNLSTCLKLYADGDLLSEKDLIKHNGTILDSAGNVMDANDGNYRYSGKAYNLNNNYKNVANEMIKHSCNEKDISYHNSCPSGSEEYYYLSYDNTKTQYETKRAAFNQAKKDGYIDFNAVKNYVCFGSNEETCPYDNLYRIIGIFNDKIKLIKADFADASLLGTDGDYSGVGPLSDLGMDDPTMYFGEKEELSLYTVNQDLLDFSSSTSLFPKMSLNTINLNTNFLNNISSEWNKMISENEWYTGEVPYYENNKYVYDLSLKEIYNYEFGNLADKDGIYKTKVGLMSMSDYGYSRSKDDWINGIAASIYENNWLEIGTIERVMPTEVYNSTGSYSVQWGYIDADWYFLWTIRPSFYLKASVKYLSGNGTIENPIRIGV